MGAAGRPEGSNLAAFLMERRHDQEREMITDRGLLSAVTVHVRTLRKTG